MLVHATPEQLAEHLGATAPVNAAALLRSASLLVSGATRNTVYDTTSSGSPTSQVLAEALADATCFQAAAWVALGIDPVKGSAAPGQVVASKSIGSAAVTYVADPGAAAARAAAVTTLCPDAVAVLAQAGLLSAAVTSW